MAALVMFTRRRDINGIVRQSQTDQFRGIAGTVVVLFLNVLLILTDVRCANSRPSSVVTERLREGGSGERSNA
jgi:hypothetical protein